jgi:hypothetical protein
MGFGSGGGASSVGGSNDVALNNPANTEVLSYNSASSKWVNAPTITQAALDAKQAASAKGQANGYASLDATTLVPREQLGTGTPDGTKVLLGNGTWATQATAPVQSVAGKTGTVTLVKADVSLGNVDNTTDLNKPISTLTQTALNGKAATVHTHATTDITSGVFSTARLPAATDTTVGVVELATNAEVVTGTDTNLAVTPAGVKAAVTASLHPVVFIDTLGDLPAGTPVDTLVVVRAA